MTTLHIGDWPRSLDNHDNGIAVVNQDGIIIAYNRSLCKLFNEERDTAIGNHFSTVRPEVWYDLQGIIQAGRPFLEHKIRFGEACLIVNQSPIIVDGMVSGAISIFQDISDHEKVISLITRYKELNHDIETIIKSSKNGLCIADGNMKILKMNDTYQNFTGIDQTDSIYHSIDKFLFGMNGECRAKLEFVKKKNRLTTIINTNENKKRIITATPIYDRKGKILFIINHARDISELNLRWVLPDKAQSISSCLSQEQTQQLDKAKVLEKIVAKSELMAKTIHKAERVACVDSSVILYGESGVGKSMLAKAIHKMSPRKKKPIVKINCSTIPDTLIESELFGYEKGAFTGAQTKGKIGLIESAQGGTIFFDEIGELELNAQVKLLEVIEEHAFKRVGGTQPIKVNVRILAATNRNLKELVASGQFREDLYYRLNVVPIHIPPLRDRKEDIPMLARNIIIKISKSQGIYKQIHPQALDLLKVYDYPGNVRELYNILERMIIMSDHRIINVSDIPPNIRKVISAKHQSRTKAQTLSQAVQQFEVKLIKKTLKRHKSNVSAAKELGIHHATLWRKLKKREQSKLAG